MQHFSLDKMYGWNMGVYRSDKRMADHIKTLILSG